jgi:hypothetical protein
VIVRYYYKPFAKTIKLVLCIFCILLLMHDLCDFSIPSKKFKKNMVCADFVFVYAKNLEKKLSFCLMCVCDDCYMLVNCLYMLCFLLCWGTYL